MIDEKGQHIQVTNENYRSVIEKYKYLIGQRFKPRNLELLYLIATDWSTHGETQQKWLRNNHSINPNDWITFTAEELEKKVLELDKIEWPEQFLEIIAIFRDEGNNRVYFEPLEHIFLQKL